MDRAYYRVFFAGNRSRITESALFIYVTPNFDHIIPISHNAIFNGVFKLEKPSVLLRFLSNHCPVISGANYAKGKYYGVLERFKFTFARISLELLLQVTILGNQRALVFSTAHIRPINAFGLVRTGETRFDKTTAAIDYDWL